jgi:cytochrome P450
MKPVLRDEFQSLEDMRSYFDQLRDYGDSFFIDPRILVVTGYEAIRDVLLDTAHFRTFDFTERLRSLQAINPEKYGYSDLQETISRWLVFMEGPEHLASKKRMTKAMYGLDLQGIIKTEWERTARTLDGRSEFDLMADLCEPLVGRIVCAIIGMDPDQHIVLRTIEKAFLKASSAFVSLDMLDETRRAHEDFTNWFNQRWNSGSLHQANLLTNLLEKQEPSSQPAVLSQVEFFMTAVVETSIITLMESIFRLLTNLKDRTGMLQDSDSRKTLVEELIRLSSSASIVSRKALHDTKVAGQPCPAGTILFLSIASANRDPRHFPYPNAVHPDNLSTPHLAFGLGRHHCIGSILSRMELETILPAFLERFGDRAHLNTEDREDIKRSFILPGISRQRVILNPPLP